MKQYSLFTMCLISSLMASSLALAVGNFKGEEFNSMINDNQKAENELRNQLQKDAGIRFDDKPGTIAREKFINTNEVEQVVASTTDNTGHRRNRTASSYNKANETTAIKRLSQEIKDAD